MTTTVQLVISIILLVFSVFLIVAVLMQEGKSHNLSGTIAGGADTFFGKSKGQTVSKKLSVLTSVVAIIFVILVVAVYVVNTENKDSGFADLLSGKDTEAVTTVAETTTATDAETTVAAAEAETTAAETEAETTVEAETTEAE